MKELACYMSHIELSPDVSVTTLDTMCGSVDYPGTVKWTLVATLYQSFDATTGTEAILQPLVTAGVPCAFAVAADKDAAISATNPAWTGQVVPQPYSPINGDAGDASEIELEWGIVGTPTKTTSPLPATFEAAAEEEAA